MIILCPSNVLEAFSGGKLNVEWIHLQVAPHLPAMFPRIEHANMQLPVYFPQVALWTLAFQNCLCLLMGFGWTVAVYRSHYLTHILVLAKYVKLPLWKMVLTLSSLLFFSYLFHVGHLGGGDTRWADSARHYSSEGEYKRIYSFHKTIWWPSLIFSFYSFII